MITRIMAPNHDAIQEAARLLRNGMLVAFPTETVYGLGANALDSQAVQRIFEAKGRPGDNPLIVHIAEPSQLAPLISGTPSEIARKLMNAFWPGPMTLIFPKSDSVPGTVTANLETVAVRIPAHPAARALIAAAGVPIAAPSANRSQRPSPTEAVHVFEDMDGRIPLILDGGPCDVGVESTVIDVTGAIPRILRPGGITVEQVAQIAGAAEVDSAVLRPLCEGEQPRSPGMKYLHYAPRGQLTIVIGATDNVIRAISEMYDRALAEGHRPLILALENHLSAYGERHRASLGSNPESMAHRIFALLRSADERSADIILSEAVEANGVGLAVMNRLARAAAFRIIEAQ